MDIKSFYQHHKGFGLSLPVLFIKMATMLAIGIVLILPLTAMAPPEGQELTALQNGFADFIAAIASVLSHAWAYASMAIGVRYMTGHDK
jgi:hypothetical protein